MNEVSCITDGRNFDGRNPDLIKLKATKVIKDIKVTRIHRKDRTLKITEEDAGVSGQRNLPTGYRNGL